MSRPLVKLPDGKDMKLALLLLALCATCRASTWYTFADNPNGAGGVPPAGDMVVLWRLYIDCGEVCNPLSESPEPAFTINLPPEPALYVICMTAVNESGQESPLACVEFKPWERKALRHGARRYGALTIRQGRRRGAAPECPVARPWIRHKGKRK